MEESVAMAIFVPEAHDEPVPRTRVFFLSFFAIYIGAPIDSETIPCHESDCRVSLCFPSYYALRRTRVLVSKVITSIKQIPFTRKGCDMTHVYYERIAGFLSTILCRSS